MFPVLFQWGAFKVHAYGFFLSLGFAVGLILAIRKGHREGVPWERILDLFVYTLVAALIGSRLFYVAVNFDFYHQHPSQAFHLWDGGLVFYGGLGLGVAVAILTLRWQRLPVWRWADLFAPYVALGLAFGRLGCFLAGCCYGNETSLPWGVTFTDPNSLAPLNVSLHPTQLYDGANGFAIFLFLKWMGNRKTFEGQVFWTFLLLYAVTRFFIEWFRGDPRGFLFGTLLSTSQAVGLVLAILSVFMLFYLKRTDRSEVNGRS